MSYNHDTTSHSEKQVNLVQIAQEVVHNLLQSYSEVQPLDADAEGMFHYVYITYRKDNYKFYVGKHSSKNPATDSYIGSGVHLQRAIEKHGIEAFEHRILCYLPTSQEAYNLEASIVSEQYIKLYRDELRITYNLVSGGIGVTGRSEETRQKISEQVNKYWEGNEEARLKASEKSKQQFEDPENRLKISMARKDYFENNPDKRKETTECLRTPEAIYKSRESKKNALLNNPQIRHNMSLASRKYWEGNEEARLKASEKSKQQFEDPEMKQKCSNAQKRRFEDPAQREAVSQYNRNKPKKLINLEGQIVEVKKQDVCECLKKGFYFAGNSSVVLHNPNTLEQIKVYMYQKKKCYKAANTPRVIKLLEEGWVIGYAPKT